MRCQFKIKIGFTLVEILVCIAIVSVLFAIVHSVYSTATFNAKRISCVSNMKQIATAMNMYRHDYDGSDSGTTFPQLGLPPHADAFFFSRYVHGIPESDFACPNRFINPNWQEREQLTKLSYSVYHSRIGTGYAFFEELNKENRPLLVYCSFHDLNHWRGNSSQCERIWHGISFDGQSVKIPEYKLFLSCRKAR